MAYAFLEYLVGNDTATRVAGEVEIIKHDQWDDPFADYFHLV